MISNFCILANNYSIWRSCIYHNFCIVNSCINSITRNSSLFCYLIPISSSLCNISKCIKWNESTISIGFCINKRFISLVINLIQLKCKFSCFVTGWGFAIYSLLSFYCIRSHNRNISWKTMPFCTATCYRICNNPTCTYSFIFKRTIWY